MKSKKFIAIIAFISILAGCSDTEVVSHTVQQINSTEIPSTTEKSQPATTVKQSNSAETPKTTERSIIETEGTTASVRTPIMSGQLILNDSDDEIETVADTSEITVYETSMPIEMEVAAISESTTDASKLPEMAVTTMAATYREFSDEDINSDFISRCVFVGDSICSGLKAYEILPFNQVLAVGNVAARNIFEDWVEFKLNGAKYDLTGAIEALQPEYIVFSMGMNDVNMTTKEQFCANYDKIFDACKAAAPNAELIVLSITPITYRDDGKLFTYSETIDSFNAALKAHVVETGTARYIDVASGMKNANNLLRDEYLGSPDGVHLAKIAYTAILSQLCSQMMN